MTAILKKHMPDAYKRVARMVGYCLLLGDDADNWHGLSVVLAARLEPHQRAALAYAALKALDHDTACLTADMALSQPLKQGEAA